jgi:hypothetical protein
LRDEQSEKVDGFSVVVRKRSVSWNASVQVGWAKKLKSILNIYTTVTLVPTIFVTGVSGPEVDNSSGPLSAYTWGSDGSGLGVEERASWRCTRSWVTHADLSL